MIDFLVPLICFGIGVILGLSQKGLTINIVHKSVGDVDKPKEYNKSMAGMLPAEVQNYYKETQGQNRF